MALVVGVAVVSSVSTTVVWAAHSFPDVPGSSPHHADISWAVNNGITQGYNDGTFRPTQAVSRQTMATFLRRLSAEFEIVQSSAPVGTGDSVIHSTVCPPGKRPLGGGGRTTSADLFMTASYPIGPAWVVRWETEDNASLGDGHTLAGYAICGPGL
jgi:hypothetical protein